ncbi:MAG: hypothetical protein ABI593_16460 [Betaproteobacteria bacterium]
MVIDASRHSVPWRLSGKTVAVVRVGAPWPSNHQGQLVAEHAVLAARHPLSVQPAQKPGAVARNGRIRFAESTAAMAPSPTTPESLGFEVRDVAVYEQLREVA